MNAVLQTIWNIDALRAGVTTFEKLIKGKDVDGAEITIIREI